MWYSSCIWAKVSGCLARFHSSRIFIYLFFTCSVNWTGSRPFSFEAAILEWIPGLQTLTMCQKWARQQVGRWLILNCQASVSAVNSSNSLSSTSWKAGGKKKSLQHQFSPIVMKSGRHVYDETHWKKVSRTHGWTWTGSQTFWFKVQVSTFGQFQLLRGKLGQMSQIQKPVSETNRSRSIAEVFFFLVVFLWLCDQTWERHGVKICRLKNKRGVMRQCLWVIQLGCQASPTCNLKTKVVGGGFFFTIYCHIAAKNTWLKCCCNFTKILALKNPWPQKNQKPASNQKDELPFLCLCL